MEWKSKLVRIVVITWVIYGISTFFASKSFLSPVVLDQFVIILIGLLFLITSIKTKHVLSYGLLVLGLIGLTSINEQSLIMLSTFGDFNESIGHWLEYRDVIGLTSLILLLSSFIYHTVLLIKSEYLWKGVVIGVFYLLFIVSMFTENNYVSEFGILLAAFPTVIICLKSDLNGVNHLFYLTWTLVSCLTILRLISFI